MVTFLLTTFFSRVHVLLVFRTFFFIPAVPLLVQVFTGMPPGVGIIPVWGGGTDWRGADLISRPVLPLTSPVMSGKLLVLFEVLFFHL